MMLFPHAPHGNTLEEAVEWNSKDYRQWDHTTLYFMS